MFDEKKKVKKQWTAVVGSYEELLAALHDDRGVEFPFLAIPLGAERTGVECRIYRNAEELMPRDEEERMYARKLVSDLLASAFPLDGKRLLHLISMDTSYDAPPWGIGLTESTLTLFGV